MLFVDYHKKQPWRFYLPCLGIFEREVRRFFAVPAQTIFAPLGSALIYFALFGMALSRLMGAGPSSTVAHGASSYLGFLIPGIMAMETLNAAFQNPVSSIMVSRWTGTLIDVLMSPVSPLGLWAAYVAGALIRAFLVGGCVFLAGSLCAWELTCAHPLLLCAAVALNAGILGGFGVLVGCLSRTWEQVGIVTSFILQPLTFFSGVFFSFQLFPDWSQWIKYANPLFYIVSMFRFAILGHSDTEPIISFGISGVFFALTLLLCLVFLRRGFGLRV